MSCSECKHLYQIEATDCLPATLRSQTDLVHLADTLYDIARLSVSKDLTTDDYGCCVKIRYGEALSIHANVRERSVNVKVVSGCAADHMQVLQAVHGQFKPKKLSVQGGLKCKAWQHFGEQISMVLDTDWSSR